MMQKTALAALKMDDVLTIVGSLCAGLAGLALAIMFYILLRKRGSGPAQHMTVLALLPKLNKKDVHAMRSAVENDERPSEIGIEDGQTPILNRVRKINDQSRPQQLERGALFAEPSNTGRFTTVIRQRR